MKTVLEKTQGSQYFMNFTSLSCPCLCLLLYPATQLNAKTVPKRLIAKDKAKKALNFVFIKKREREGRKEEKDMKEKSHDY